MADDFISQMQAAQDADAAAAAATPSANSPPSGGDFLSELEAAQNADANGAPVSTTADVAKSAGQGLIEGTEGLAGLPGDIESLAKRGMDWATSPIDYGMLWAQGWAAQKAGMLPAGQTPSTWATNKLSQLNATRETPVNDTTADVAARAQQVGVPNYQPQTTAGQYARTIGSFVPGALTMPAESAADVGANLAKYALTPGALSEAAGQFTAGTPIEPYARTAGALFGGIGADLAPAAVGQAWNAGRAFAEPFSAAGQTNIAARTLAGTFTDPQAASAELAKAAALQTPGAGLGEIVPGSRPTTGQLTGDLGALNFERGLATADPESFKANEFGTGSVQQNAARAQALQGIQPTGSPEAVGQAVRDQLASIEAAHSRAVSDALDQAQQSAAGIGSGAPPEVIGANLRSALQGALDDAKMQEQALWQAVDPDRSLALPSAPITGAASSIAKSIPSTAKPMQGEEGAIFNVAANLPPVTPFNDVTALRSRISTAMKQELIAAGQSPTYARLAQLRGAVENAISDAATHKAAQDEAAVSAGEISPTDSIGARFERGTSQVQGLPVSGLPAGEVSAQIGTTFAPGRAETGGANSSGDLGLRNDARGQGIPGYVPRPNGEILGPGKVFYPNGSLDVNYELANLPDLVTSHDTNFRVNKAYPTDLQPRAREQAPAQDQVNSMAARLQPERLGRSPEANSGAPIVGPDNVVESGNGRTLALAKAYSAGRGGDYRQWLAAQGIDARGVAKPVLIARRVSPLSPEDRVAFAHSANTASGLAMTDGEKAFADARLMSPASISHLSDSGLASTENQPFVRSFLAQLPATERADLLDAQGGLSQKGLRRLEMATMAKAYGDGDFIDKAFVARDLNVRGLAGALTDAAPSWLKMREAAREGLIDPAHDVTPALMTAARGVVRAREAGRPISEVLNQGDLFGDEASAQAKGFLTNGKGQLANRQQIADRLRTYAGEAQKNLAAPGLFGDTVSPGQVMRASLARTGGADAITEPPSVSQAMKPPLTANMDQGAVDRLKVATNATKKRVNVFGQGPVGAVLRKAGNQTDYRLPDSVIPGKLFAAGPRGAETVASYRQAAGHAGPPNMNPLLDAAAESLRRDAMTPEGVIDPVKFARWQAKYQDTLRALPPALRSKFASAASATQAYSDAAAARKAAIGEYEKSQAGKFLGLSAPEDITKTVGQLLTAKDGARRMRALSNSVSRNPEAQQGLRKAVADAILTKATGATEAGASGVNTLNAATLLKFLRDNRFAIKAAGFSDREFGSMQAVANDIQRSQRTLQATRLPGLSNTAQDTIKAIEAAKSGHQLSLLSKLAGGAYLGFEHGGLWGAVGGAALAVGEHLGAALRGAGLAKAHALVRDAMLNPELAAELLKKAPARPDSGTERTVAKMLARNAMFSAMQATRPNGQVAATR